MREHVVPKQYLLFRGSRCSEQRHLDGNIAIGLKTAPTIGHLTTHPKPNLGSLDRQDQLVVKGAR